MEQVIQCLQNYWKEITYLVVGLIVVIISLVRRKNVINQEDQIKAKIISILPMLINGVETPGNGVLKKKTVIGLVKQFLHKTYGFTEIALDSFDAFISNAIEMFLVTPQRKEIKNEEKSQEVRR